MLVTCVLTHLSRGNRIRLTNGEVISADLLQTKLIDYNESLHPAFIGGPAPAGIGKSTKQSSVPSTVRCQ